MLRRMVRPSGKEAPGARRCGQADLHSEPRARVCSYAPARFKNSKAVGPSLGLTPRLNQSGESHRVGRVSLCGDPMMRTLLYEAGQSLLTRVQKCLWVKAWAMNVAKRRGLQKAIVALARRLSVIMHRMWHDGTEFRWTRQDNSVAACRPASRRPSRMTQPDPPAGGKTSFAGRWME